MSVTRTFTVTVAYADGGNKYFLDGVQQAEAYLVEGNTYRFDQSDSSNSNHPLRFSTTSNGTHSGGSEYTTGVTTNGTPGSSGAYTEIVVASDAPTLYYYCTNHSGMGGTAYTPSEGWDVGAWGAGRYGVADALTLGWGAKNWDSSGSWGDMGDETITPTGFGLTSSLGSVSVSTEINTGWGRQPWNENAWGIAGDVLLEGVSATASVGDPTITSNPTVLPTGLSATVSVGSISPADVIGLTGVSATTSVGSLTPADVMGLTGQSATASVAAFGTATGFGIQAYQSVDTGSNSSYTNVATGSNTSYSDAA